MTFQIRVLRKLFVLSNLLAYGHSAFIIEEEIASNKARAMSGLLPTESVPHLFMKDVCFI